MAQVQQNLRHSSWLTVPRVVSLVVVAAFLSVGFLTYLTGSGLVPDAIREPVSPWVLMLFRTDSTTARRG